MLRRLLGRGPKPGSVWTGERAYCADPILVAWPGLYAVVQDKRNHWVVDPKIRLEFDDDGETARVVA